MSSENGIVTIRSKRSVDETVKALQHMLEERGVKLFAAIDHSGEALKAGFAMRPCMLLIFGNPRAGTPLMLAAPTAALDLPLKLLVWEDADGSVWISYNDSAWLQRRHGLPAELMVNVAVAQKLAAEVAE